MAAVVETLNQYEKSAIVSLQSILNARERIDDEKFGRFSFFVNKLPPHRALVVFGYTLNAVADRMSDEDPHKLSLKRMGRSIAKQLGANFIHRAETDPDFYQQNRQKMAESLCDISDMMRKIVAEKRK